MKSLKRFITESIESISEDYLPVDKKILNFLKRDPNFSKMRYMKVCSASDPESEHDETSFEDNAAYEIFAKACQVEDCSNVSDDDYTHHFNKINVKDKLITTYRGNYCGAISGKADGKDFILAFELYYNDDENRKNFVPFRDFDKAINTVKNNDGEAIWMALAVLYM